MSQLESALRALNGGPRSYHATCTVNERLYEARRTEADDRRTLAFNGVWENLETTRVLDKVPTNTAIPFHTKVIVIEGKINGNDGKDYRGRIHYTEAWSLEGCFKIADMLMEREAHLAKQKRRTNLIKRCQPLEEGLDNSSLDYDYEREHFIVPAEIEVTVWVPSQIFNDLRTADLKKNEIKLSIELTDHDDSFANVAISGYRLLWKVEVSPGVQIDAFHFHIQDLVPTPDRDNQTLEGTHPTNPVNPFEMEVINKFANVDKKITWCVMILFGILLTVFFKK